MPAPSLSPTTPRDPRFGEVRDALTWNKRLASARSPAAIVHASSVADAASAVAYARDNALRVSPRCSGHHYEAAALRDGGLLLDLSELNRVEIDRESSTAWVGAGTRGGDLIEVLAAAGLGFPVGHCADVALGGYLLAGGFGWNAGAWGPASSGVLAIEAVLASGETVHADRDSHPDLFWAVRGGGPGFFAAITAYHLQLQPLPLAAFAWSAPFAAEDAPRLADWLTAATAAADAAAEVIALVGAQPKTGRPAVTVRAIACGESDEEARGMVASFHSPPVAPIGEITEESIPFAGLHKFSAMPSGKRVAADHAWSDASMGELLLAVHHLAEAPSKLSTINLVSFGGNGAVRSPPDGSDSALSVGGTAGAGIYAMWDDPADDEPNRAWVREVDAALAPLRSARYVGEADLTAGSERLAQCFTREALDRLEAVRQRYDPDGVFFTYP